MSCRALLFLAAAAVLAAHGTRSPAQQPKVNPPVPPPQFPTLTTPASLGVKAGTPAELTLTGTNLLDAVGVLTTAPGVKATVAPNQKDAGKLVVKFDPAADAPIGLYQLRVVTKYGVSNARPLCVDELPEVAEKGGNAKRELAQPITAPCVVAGTADGDASDFYRLAVRPGQRLTVEVFGRRLGSPVDPVLILWDAKADRELPGLYADDTPGCQSDARVTHTFKDSAEILVEVRDTTYRGGGEFAYRLRIADAPAATTTFPLAITSDAEVGFAGLHLNGVKPVKVSNPTAPAALVRPKRDGVSGWPVPVRVVDFPTVVETEPNNDAKTATKLPVPGGVSGRFAEKGDLDFFAFAGKKGQKLEITAAAYELNAPTEIYLRVLDAKGAELAKSDPAKPLAATDFTPPADGEFFVAAEHLNYQHGPHEVYFLSVRPAEPDFEVSLGLDRVDVSVNRPGLLPVVGLTKRHGFDAPLELKVIGDGLAGSLTLPAGANPTLAAPLYLPVAAKPGTKPGGVRFRVSATSGGKARLASALDGVRAGMSALPNPPPEFAPELAAVVVEKPLFELSVTLDKSEVAKGGTIKGKLTAKRADGFADEITPTAVGLPANVTAKLKPIAKDKTEAEFELTAAGNAAAGGGALTVRGTAKPGGREFAYASPAVAFTVTDPKKDDKKPEKK